MCSSEQPETEARTRFTANVIDVATLLVAGAALACLFAPVKTPSQTVARTVEKLDVDATEVEQLRKQVAAQTAQKDAAEAALADSQQSLQGCRRLIDRYIEELDYVDELNVASQRGPHEQRSH